MQFAPFILTPSSLPRGEYEKSLWLQPLLNKLMHRVAHDNAFLCKTLLETIKVDEFTGNLFKIYDKVHKDDKKQVRKPNTYQKLVMLPRSGFRYHLSVVSVVCKRHCDCKRLAVIRDGVKR